MKTTDDKKLEERVIADEPVFEGKLLKVRQLTVTLPNGKTSHREMIRHPGAAAMIALDEEGCIVLERQWRAPAGGAFWEIPAGKIDPGESAFDAARRELAEEAGLTADRWVYLGNMHNVIGYSNEHIEVFLAQNLRQTHQHLDENEFLTLVKTPWKDALAMTRNGEITDVKTMVGLNWLAAYFEGTLPQARVL